MNKLIAISMRVIENSTYIEKRDCISFEMISFLEKIDINTILIPNSIKNIKKYLKNFDIDGLILNTGNNVCPSRYENSEILNDSYSERDITEEALLDYSIKRKIPILGLCRGFQFINVYFGGSIKHAIVNHVNVDHQLISNQYNLNNKTIKCYHNQGIKKENLGKSLEIVAMSRDGYVEAFENKNLKVLGLQWHPEREHHQFNVNIIKNHFSL